MITVKDIPNMGSREISLIAQAYIERYRKFITYDENFVFYENDINPWVRDLMFELLSHYPEKVFLVIDEVLLRTDNEDVLCDLAAGPLESLLIRYGEAVMPQIEYRARNSSKFKSLLPLMFQVTSDELWERIMALANTDR